MLLALALFSCFSWGIGDFFGAVAARKIGYKYSSAYNLLFSFIFASFFSPFFLKELSHLTVKIFLINLCLAVIFAIGLLSFNIALSKTHPSIVATVSASFLALTVLLSVIFFGDVLSKLDFILIVLIFIGVTVVSVDIRQLRIITHQKTGLIFAFITLISWGVYYTFIRIPVEQIGWFWPQFITLSLFPFIFLTIRHSEKKQGSFILPAIFSGILVAAGEFSYNYAIEQNISSLVAPIAGSYPIIVVVLSYFFFKDKLDKIQIAGIIGTLIGVILLGYFHI